MSSKNPSGIVEFEIEIGTESEEGRGCSGTRRSSVRRSSVGPDGLRFEYEAFASTCTSAADAVAPTSLSVEGLCAGTQYAFQIRARNKSFWGEWSEPFIIETKRDARRHALARLNRVLMKKIGDGGGGGGLRSRFQHLNIDVSHRRILLNTPIPFGENSAALPDEEGPVAQVVYELVSAIKMLQSAVMDIANDDGEGGARVVVRVEGHADSALGGRDSKRLSVNRAAAMHALMVAELGGERCCGRGMWGAANEDADEDSSEKGGVVTLLVYQGMSNARSRRRRFMSQRIPQEGKREVVNHAEAAFGHDAPRYDHGEGAISICFELEDEEAKKKRQAAAPFVQLVEPRDGDSYDKSGEARKWIGIYTRTARVEGGGADGDGSEERTPVYRGPGGKWLWCKDCAPHPSIAPAIGSSEGAQPGASGPIAASTASRGAGAPGMQRATPSPTPVEDWAQTVVLHRKRSWHLGYYCDVGTDVCSVWLNEPVGGVAAGIGLSVGHTGVQGTWWEPFGWESAAGVTVTIPSKEEAGMRAREPLVVHIAGMPEEHDDLNGRYLRVSSTCPHEGGSKDAQERPVYHGGLNSEMYAFFEHETGYWCFADEQSVGSASDSSIGFDGGCGVVRVKDDARSLDGIDNGARWEASKGWKAVHSLRLNINPLASYERPAGGDGAAAVDMAAEQQAQNEGRETQAFSASLWRQRRKLHEAILLPRRASAALKSSTKPPKAKQKKSTSSNASHSIKRPAPFDPTIVNLRGQALGRARLPLSARLKYFYSMFDPNKAKRTQAVMAEASQYIREGETMSSADEGNTDRAVVTMTAAEKKAAGQAAALSKLNRRLQEIYGCNLDRDPLPNAAPKLLAHALALNTHVVSLYLDKTGLDAEGLGHLAKTLGRHSTLQELYLNKNDLGDEGARLLARHMLTDLSNISSLSARLLELTQSKREGESTGTGGGGGGGGGGGARGGCLHRPSLTWLHISDCGIGAEGAAHLGRALKTNCTLNTVVLGSNHIGSEGAASFADALRFNSALDFASLDDNGIGTEGVAALTRALGANTGLQTLNLSNNDFAAEAEADIAVAELLSSVKIVR
jgi:hypothetical protein